MTIPSPETTALPAASGLPKLAGLAALFGLAGTLTSPGVAEAYGYARVWTGLQLGDATWNDGDATLAAVSVGAAVVLLAVLTLISIGVCRRHRLMSGCWVPLTLVVAVAVGALPLALATN